MTFGDIGGSFSSHQLEHPLNSEVTHPLPMMFMMFNIVCSYFFSGHLYKIINYMLGRDRDYCFKNSFDFLLEFAFLALHLGRSPVLFNVTIWEKIFRLCSVMRLTYLTLGRYIYICSYIPNVPFR